MPPVTLAWKKSMKPGIIKANTNQKLALVLQLLYCKGHFVQLAYKHTYHGVQQRRGFKNKQITLLTLLKFPQKMASCVVNLLLG